MPSINFAKKENAIKIIGCLPGTHITIFLSESWSVPHGTAWLIAERKHGHGRVLWMNADTDRIIENIYLPPKYLYDGKIWMRTDLTGYKTRFYQLEHGKDVVVHQKKQGLKRRRTA